MNAEARTGLVVAGFGRHYIVESADGTRRICHPRGKKSECVVGDRVRWQPTGDEGVIDAVETRRNLLFLLAAPVFGFFVSPLFARLSRKHEFEADAYACAQASGAALAAALLKLHEDNASTLTPDPVYARFYYSHPPAAERLAALPMPAA